MTLEKNFFLKNLIIVFFTLILFSTPAIVEENLADVKNELKKITSDLKTLEKAFYKTSEIQSVKISPNNSNEDVLTRHLLKLNEIEEQFQELTNKYEEINFKIDIEYREDAPKGLKFYLHHYHLNFFHRTTRKL